MAIDTRISFYGIGIENHTKQLDFYGIGIELEYLKKQVDFYGIGIEGLNVFNGKLQIVDNDGVAISGATVSITSTQTVPGNYVGNLVLTTDANGTVEPTGSSTVGTELKIEKSGYSTYIGTLNGILFGGNNYSLQVEGAAAASKKIYTTNKGNILINPNDTILIELD